MEPFGSGPLSAVYESIVSVRYSKHFLALLSLKKELRSYLIILLLLFSVSIFSISFSALSQPSLTVLLRLA